MLRICHWAALLAICFWVGYVAAAPLPGVQWPRLSVWEASALADGCEGQSRDPLSLSRQLIMGAWFGGRLVHLEVQSGGFREQLGQRGPQKQKQTQAIS